MTAPLTLLLLSASQPALAAGAAPAASPTAGFGPQTEVVHLKYADISEVAGVLVTGSNVATNDAFSPVQTNIGASSLSGTFGGVGGVTGVSGATGSSGVAGAGVAQPATPQTLGEGQSSQGGQNVAQRVNENIAVDRRLNAIILSGTPNVVAALRAIIDKLDIPVRSVILETQIVELSNTAARNIGIDFSPDASGIVVNATRGTTASGNTPASGSSTPATGGLTIGTQQEASSGATLQAALYAQVSEGHGRVIAKPRIIAQSGQQASILTGDAIPIFTNIAVQNVGSSQQVNYVNVGVDLQIAPRVSSDGFVTSHIYSEVSSVTAMTQSAPQISQRTASTIATVRDGNSFVIGGLLQDSELRNLTKLPFIGEIPLIGDFFHHVDTSHHATNLYIIVTPHVIGPAAVVPASEPPATPAPGARATPATSAPR